MRNSNNLSSRFIATAAADLDATDAPDAAPSAPDGGFDWMTAGSVAISVGATALSAYAVYRAVKALDQIAANTAAPAPAQGTQD